jgi:hypothetical protein
LDYQYYLPRVDKVILNKDKTFEVLLGTPNLNPVEPKDKSGSMTLYILRNAPYLTTTDDIDVQYIDNKRYTMRDIGAIDKRVDWNFLAKLYSTGCFESIDLFGPSKVADFESKGISLCGAVKYRDICNVLKSYDCAILPFRSTRSNSSRSPMKLTEYLLNGLKVISTPSFVLPEEMKQFEAAVLSFEQNMNERDIEKFMSQEIYFILKDDFKSSFSFESTASLILELGAGQT